MNRSGFVLIGLLGLMTIDGAARAGEPQARATSFTITVRAGKHDRRDSLVTFAVPPDRLDAEVTRVLLDRPVGLLVTDLAAPRGAKPSTAEAHRQPDGTIRATWFLPRPIPAGGEARFEVDGGPAARDAPSPWTALAAPGRAVTIGHHPDRPVLRYNAGPTTPPPTQPNPNLIRDAYIHPAYSPSGALVTGDFSPHHPHHRGVFLAYVHTRWGDLAPDFWNIQSGTGRIVADGFDRPVLGPVAGRFEVRHRWEAIRPRPTGNEHRVALRERWAIELYDVPGSPYWLFDLTATQQAEGHPLEVLPYRYGGMAYRSAEPSVRGPLDVLTAEGRHRFDGDQKPTRWVDLTGPVAEASPNYAGALIADHPTNPQYPTVVRIHPITLPFFSFVPSHDGALTIRTDQPTTFRYRIMIHDGRPDPALNDRIGWDFTDPAEVTVN